MIYVWAMEHQSEEDGQRWEQELDRPLPRQSMDSIAEDELKQLEQLQDL